MFNFVANYRNMRFLGNIESKTDAKGRVFIPSAFRKIIQAEEPDGDVLVLRMHYTQPCLVLYPMTAWNRITDALSENVNEFDSDSEMIYRVWVSEAEKLPIDGSGRVLIPRRYLDLADIKQSVRFIGVRDTIEIWAAEKMEKPFFSQADFAAKLQALMAKK